jgi:hypothetical protein
MTSSEIADPDLWELIQPHIGEVKSARRTERGYSSDLTALVEGEKGEFFVKAMRITARGWHYSAIRERDINPHVQPLAPALCWAAEDETWVALGFEMFDGRRADFDPGSADLPVAVELLRKMGELKLPDVAREWPERRWNRFISEEDAALLQGDALLHTDINPSNFMIGVSEARIVDWAWPTRGAGFIDPSILVVQLISSGHSPAQAESWVAKCPAWSEADPRAIDAFARAEVRMRRHLVEQRPDEPWLGEMVAAAESWTAHRGVPTTLDRA